MAKKEGYCETKNCRRESAVICMGKGYCDEHWAAHCRGEV